MAPPDAATRIAELEKNQKKPKAVKEAAPAKKL
jgi:hypothetical protein